MMGFRPREISNWPVIGWLAARGETIFHHRGSTESLGGVLHEMLSRLRQGRSVGVFPEGGTRGGEGIGPFHARIFLAAVEAGVPVQPVALRYGEHGNAQKVVAFAPGEHFLGNFLRLLGEPARIAEVHFLEPIGPGDTEGRRRIAVWRASASSTRWRPECGTVSGDHQVGTPCQDGSHRSRIALVRQSH
jgi:1-acyl-sn-glycerol-3-phosphate acyltransferase